jgi:hypothetical protein
VVQGVRTAEATVSEGHSAIEVSLQLTDLAQRELDGYKQMFKLGKVCHPGRRYADSRQGE